MSNLDRCLSEVLKAVNEARLPELSDKEIKAIGNEIENERSRIFNSDEPLKDSKFREKVVNMVREMRYQALVERKNALQNAIKLSQNIDYVFQPGFANNPRQAIRGKLVGGTTAITVGGNDSAAQMGHNLAGQITHSLYFGFKREGIQAVMEKGMIDSLVSQELWELRKGGNPGSTGSKEAMAAARVIAATNDMALGFKQAAGSAVRKLDGYITRTIHDPKKLFDMGEAAWKELILKHFDIDKTFENIPAKQVDDILSDMWKGITSGDGGDKPLFSRGADLSKQQSWGRTLIPKDGLNWHEYNTIAGTKNLVESVMDDGARAARQAGLMHHFGTNPEAGFEALIKRVRERLDGNEVGLKSLNENINSLREDFKVAMGVGYTPGTSLFARGGQAARAFETISKTGFAFASSFPDLAVAAAMIRSSTGKSIFQTAHDLIGGYLSAFTAGEKRVEAAARLGIVAQDIQGHMFAKYGVGEIAPGRLSKAVQMFSKMNLIKFHDEAGKLAVGDLLAKDMAAVSGSRLSELSAWMRSGLERYGFTDLNWDIARLGVESANGVSAITPEAIRKIPDEKIGSLIEASGLKATKGAIREAKFTTLSRYLAYVNEHASTSVAQAGPRQRAMLLGASIDDGGWGTLRRLLVQFKQIPLLIANTAERSFLSNPETRPATLADALKNRTGDFAGFTQFFLLSTVLGYASMTAKEAASGKTPRDPMDPNVWREAMIRGGAFGLYGDFLVAELKRSYGAGALDIAAGPVLGTAASAADLFRNLHSEDVSAREKAGKAVRLLYDNLPGHNLPYVKGALDYHVLSSINEYLNPGYRRRQEERTKNKSGLLDAKQDYFMFQPTR